MTSNARKIVLDLISGGMTKAAIADEIGYGRASVSRWINEPDYNGAHIEAAVLERYSRFPCPHLKSDITPKDCAAHALRTCPTSNTRDARHWRACQACPHRPEAKS
ncbi:hypothetical protein [Propionivibrio dicarboxylicus]|uniref:Homeodomain-like domain-containing protein n=1 Tax=Propionivibrio dicarboxylicus TaxID=83767 RepID=A0A1G8L9H4_9RHOO|nr:hypothetical protein [Propionivibrio dicarboxylicus]SDI52282.1 hypothetical protein SAMN05660652_03578 [Propionivibrio dicarboxylicus]